MGKNGSETPGVDSNFASSALYNIALQAQKTDVSRVPCCRKCLGHGQRVPYLNGHVSACPFSGCSCAMCAHVLYQRASSIVRRCRMRQTHDQLAMRKTARFGDGMHALPIKGLRDQKSPTNQNLRVNVSTSLSEMTFSNSQTILSLAPTVSCVPATQPTQYRVSNSYGPQTLPPHQSHELSWSTISDSAIAAVLATPSSVLLAQLESSTHMASKQSPEDSERYPALIKALNSPTDSLDSLTSDANSFTSFTSSISCPEESMCEITTSDQLVYLPVTTSEASLLGGERLSRNLYVPYDANRSHPSFSHFISAVKHLEQTMLG